jgi:butyryl-CoA dehydrogenase
MPVSLSKYEAELFEEAKKFSIECIQPLVSLVEHGEKKISDVLEFFNKHGFCSLLIPKELGGKGYTFLESALIYEGLAHGSGILTFLLQLHNNITYEIAMLYEISPEIKSLLHDLIEGRKTISFAFTEESSGSDAASICSYAELKSDGYHVHGKKVWIANAGDADYFNVVVRESKDSSNMIMLLIDRNSTGFKISDTRVRLGGNAVSCCDLEFDNCIVPVNRVLSKNGFKDALVAIDIARIFVPAIVTGIATSAVNQTVDYLSERVSFGKPIIKQQGIQWSLAEMQTKIEAGKWMAYHCATKMDEKLLTRQEAAMNKLITTDTAMEVTLKCMQFQGANGFMAESNIARMVSEAKMCQLIDGTSEIQKIIIGRALGI